MSETQPNDKIYGVSVEEWKAAFAPTVQEFPATRFTLIGDGPLVRLAFGHSGQPLDEEGSRGAAVYSVAISMSPILALELRDLLDRIIQVQEPPKHG